jgi:hypothetical protein
MKKVFLFIGLIGLMFSCQEETHYSNCGTATFSWKANGTFHEGHSVFFYHSLSLNDYSLTACSGTGGNNPTLSFRLHDPLAVGVYNLAHINQATTPNTGDGSYLDGSGNPYFTTDTTHNGTITLTAVNPDSAITGTFAFTGIRYSTSELVTITEGQFTAIK